MQLLDAIWLFSKICPVISIMERSVSLPTRKDEEPKISKNGLYCIILCQYAALLYTIRAIYLHSAVVIFCSSCGSGKPVEWGNAAVCMSTGQ